MERRTTATAANNACAMDLVHDQQFDGTTIHGHAMFKFKIRQGRATAGLRPGRELTSYRTSF
jgi:hypothetical protein